MTSQLEEISFAQGGGGVAVRGNTQISQPNTQYSLGKTPGPGTNATVYLKCGGDAGYIGAVVQHYVLLGGVTVLYQSYQITAAALALGGDLEVTASGCAAEQWEIRITSGAALPATNLLSALIAYGVENINFGGSSTGTLTQTGNFTGPGAGGTFSFPIPKGQTIEYSVSVMARITSSAVGPVGASFATQAVYTWENVGGAVALVPVDLSAPNTSSDAALAATTASVGAAAGSATVTFALPGTLDASTVTEVSVTLVPLGTV